MGWGRDEGETEGEGSGRFLSARRGERGGKMRFRGGGEGGGRRGGGKGRWVADCPQGSRSRLGIVRGASGTAVLCIRYRSVKLVRCQVSGITVSRVAILWVGFARHLSHKGVRYVYYIWEEGMV